MVCKKQKAANVRLNRRHVELKGGQCVAHMKLVLNECRVYCNGKYNRRLVRNGISLCEAKLGICLPIEDMFPIIKGTTR